MTCPNRDGTLGNNGCIFCSEVGSGDFAIKKEVSVQKQIELGKNLFQTKKIGNKFIAYFQSFTNTYAPISYLEQIYTEALNVPEVIGLSIATRPDCISMPIIALIEQLKLLFPTKFIWIELGLQTIHEETANYIRRGYPLGCFTDTVSLLKQSNIPIIVHVILGLPGETKYDMLQTVAYLNSLSIFGIKLQLLHVLKNTDLATDYNAGFFTTLSLDEYLDILISCIEILSPEIVIHRVTGDGPKNLLIAPTWSLNKRNVLNLLHQKMKQRCTYQGKEYHGSGVTYPL